MPCIGFNINKGELHYCVLQGTKSTPAFIDLGVHKFNPNQTRTELSNFFKQTFKEIIDKYKPSIISYRLSLEAKSSEQLSYLVFPYGILNLIAHESGLQIHEYVLQSFTKRALGFDGDKFEACNSKISNFPTSAKKEDRVAALSAWMTLQ